MKNVKQTIFQKKILIISSKGTRFISWPLFFFSSSSLLSCILSLSTVSLCLQLLLLHSVNILLKLMANSFVLCLVVSNRNLLLCIGRKGVVQKTDHPLFAWLTRSTTFRITKSQKNRIFDGEKKKRKRNRKCIVMYELRSKLRASLCSRLH